MASSCFQTPAASGIGEFGERAVHIWQRRPAKLPNALATADNQVQFVINRQSARSLGDRGRLLAVADELID
jgi:hypothetical protein